MAIRIHSFQSSINTCYLVRDRGTILIDAGYPGLSSSFSRFLGKLGVDPGEIKLIVLTHGDFDHVGGCSELKTLTGADVAIHEKDRRHLEEGIFHWPPGVTAWGKVSRAMLKPLMKRMASFPAVKADLVLGDNDLPLEDFGIPGRIVYTPGHTRGSVSILLDSGEAFSGCLFHNKMPFVLRPRPPIYAQDIGMLKESLRKLIDRGAKVLYPGHGKPVQAETLLKYLT